MEILRRPSGLEATDPVGRSKSAIAKARPVSVQASSRYDLPHDSETSRSSLDLPHMQYEGGAPLRPVRTEIDRDYERANISSDVDYLRAKEEEESNRKREKRSSSGAKHAKRGSLSSLSLSGSKTLFAGRFGEAFRRFESTNQEKASPPTAEEYPQHHKALTNDSDALDSPPNEGLSSYEDDVLEDVDRDDISPEMRRELERRRLSLEEKRVANAAAEYRRRVAEGDGSSQHRSRAILNRVQTSLANPTNPMWLPRLQAGMGSTPMVMLCRQSKVAVTTNSHHRTQSPSRVPPVPFTVLVKEPRRLQTGARVPVLLRVCPSLPPPILLDTQLLVRRHDLRPRRSQRICVSADRTHPGLAPAKTTPPPSKRHRRVLEEKIGKLTSAGGSRVCLV